MANTGWIDAGSGANVDRNGKNAWDKVEKIVVSDDDSATGGLDKDDYNDYLRAYSFNFDIPSGAEISGVEIRIEKKTTWRIR